MFHSGSEAGSYSRLVDFVYHSTLGWRVMNKYRGVDLGLEAEQERCRAGMPGSILRRSLPLEPLIILLVDVTL